VNLQIKIKGKMKILWQKIGLPLLLILITLIFFIFMLQTRTNSGFLPTLSGLLFVFLGTGIFFYLYPRPGLIPLLLFHFFVGNYFILFPAAQTTQPFSFFYLICFTLIPPTLIHFTFLISEMFVDVRKRFFFYGIPYLISFLSLGPSLYFFFKNPPDWMGIHYLLIAYLALAYLFWLIRLVWILQKPHLELDRTIARYLLLGQLIGFIVPIGLTIAIFLGGISFPIHWVSPLVLLFPISLLVGVIPGKRRQMETYIVQSEKRQTFGNLLAGLAHELNNPLNFIYSNLEPLRESLEFLKGRIVPQDDKSSEVFRDLDHIVASMEEGVTRARGLVEKFRGLPYTRREQKEEVDLNKILEQSIDLLSHKWKGRIRIEKKLEEIPKIQGYPLELGQVFTNLLSNACDAILQNGVIFVSSHQGSAGIKISIRDTGKGIPKEEMGRVFDPFFTTKTQGEGTGLGLSITLQKIKNHKGSIEVKSEVGKGTEFLILLPY
jgi:signal transduction histidine kinase